MALAVIIGCYGDTSYSDHLEIISKETELKDKMCACHAPACAERISAERDAYFHEERIVAVRDIKYPPEELTKLEMIRGDYESCKRGASH